VEGLSYHNRAELSAQVAGKLFGSPLKASVTRIETFATCPFKHFAQFGLNLRPCEEQDVTAMDLGNVYHQILERLVRECLVNRQDWCEIQPKVSEEMIKEYSAEVGRSLRGELMLSTARNQYLLKRIEKTLKQVVAAQRETLRRGEFRPAWAELAFGGKDALLPPHTVNTPRGNVVELQGKIDRVDSDRKRSGVCGDRLQAYGAAAGIGSRLSRAIAATAHVPAGAFEQWGEAARAEAHAGGGVLCSVVTEAGAGEASG
jgi:ATP-dependent helicase/nuclease subunit B